MGSSQNKELKAQSLPCLPNLGKQNVYAEIERVREPLASKEQTENIIPQEEVGKDENQTYKQTLKQKIGEVKLKKVREILKNRK
jgi:hypothetical protein